ncbi:copper chaperone PCu(A)C [Rhodoligotrophos appendicifer]|nr:copper chaperone PCu(A)C [Rhodoligotrophos appendicifer]
MRSSAKVLLAVGLTLGSLAAFALDSGVGNLKLSHPWIRPLPAGAKVAAGYLTIQNAGNVEDRLLAISSPAADNVELHEMVMDGDVMKMRALDEIRIEPAEIIDLKPGGNHLMFMGLRESFKAGDDILVRFQFAKSGPVEIVMPVLWSPEVQGSSHKGHVTSTLE